MIDGHITERGTFEEVMANRGEFSRTFDEFVTKGLEDSEGEKAVEIEDVGVDENAEKRRAARRGAAIIQAEERNIGAMNLQVYMQFFQSGGGVALLSSMFVTTVLMQASTVLSLYWYVLLWYQSVTWQTLTDGHADRLVWWQERCVFLRF
jgi:ATP-binding cassette subfamily C (CFTR/MRP) protein 1